MTNIEYYGFKNLQYDTYYLDFSDKLVCMIYYKCKHASESSRYIKLKSMCGTREELVKEKTKWLVEEFKPCEYYGGKYIIDDTVGLYEMRHSVYC